MAEGETATNGRKGGDCHRLPDALMEETGTAILRCSRAKPATFKDDQPRVTCPA
jgi:hypothetical protein